MPGALSELSYTGITVFLWPLLRHARADLERGGPSQGSLLPLGYSPAGHLVGSGLYLQGDFVVGFIWLVS